MEAVTKKLVILFFTFGTCFAGLVPIHSAEFYSSPNVIHGTYYQLPSYPVTYNSPLYIYESSQPDAGVKVHSTFLSPFPYNYYGTHVYDFRHLIPVVPNTNRGLYPMVPPTAPAPEPMPENPMATTENPEDIDTIEKLDAKMAPEVKVDEDVAKSASESEDTIAIEAAENTKEKR